MGVINITPDSFSDGGEFNNSNIIQKKIQELKKFDVLIYDIGAESTAPFNNSISIDQEIDRFKQIFFNQDVVKNIDQEVIISIDTYKAETFRYVYENLKKSGLKNIVIWNDVSGVIDNQLLSTLEEFPDIYYVMSHTNVKQRKSTSSHMDNPFEFKKEDAINNMVDYFKDALDKLPKQRVILDPCFGFSKTIQHNHFLIKNLKEVLAHFDSDMMWLFAVSRKSFYKKLIDKESQDSSFKIQSEYFHTNTISRWINELSAYHYILRIHDPAVLDASIKYVESFTL